MMRAAKLPSGRRIDHTCRSIRQRWTRNERQTRREVAIDRQRQLAWLLFLRDREAAATE